MQNKLINNRLARRVLVSLGAVIALTLTSSTAAFAGPGRSGSSSSGAPWIGDYINSGYILIAGCAGLGVAIILAVHAFKDAAKKNYVGMATSCLVGLLALMMITGSMFSMLQGTASKIDEVAKNGSSSGVKGAPEIKTPMIRSNR